MTFFKKVLLFCALCSFTLIYNNVQGQQYTSKKVRSIHQAYTDSLKQINYDYIFPILGQGAYKKGFDIPYPVGLMGNYMWLQQSILINDLQLGYTSATKDVALTPVDFIRFGDNTNTSYTVNFRPDLWVFPFLNVSGIFGYGHSSTEVNLVAPIEMQSIVTQNITTAGFGLMTAFGVGPVFVSVDANFTWNKPELLDKAVPVRVFGLRIGHTFIFNKKPYRNIAIWTGAQSLHMGASTVGQISMEDALPASAWEKADEIVNDYWAWYNALDPSKPIDQAKIEKADEVLTPIVDAIDNADGSSVVKYSMNKQVKSQWNGIIGMQFQLNKSWMIRSEGGIIGDRKSFLISINWRFKA